MTEYLKSFTAAQRVVILAVLAIDLILLVRILLIFFPRIPDGFYWHFYLISQILISPFSRIAGNQIHNIDDYTFAHIVDKACVIGIIVYTVIGFVAVKLLSRNNNKR